MKEPSALPGSSTNYKHLLLPSKWLFQLIESSKAILLLESINESIAKGTAGIPDSLLQRDEILNREIAFYERKKAEEEKKVRPKAEKIAVLDQQLFDLKQQKQALVQGFEKDYPRYYRLKFDTQLASIAEVQQQILSDSSLLLEYFLGQDELYILTIGPNQASVKKTPRPPHLAEDVERLRNYLNSLPRPESIRQDFQEYTELAHRFYRLLIEPAEVFQNFSRLTIVPDDLLGYLPFEVLLRQKPNSDEVDFSPLYLDYLLNHCQVAYSYSSTLLLQNQLQQGSSKASKTFLGFAPSFGGEEKLAGSLRNCTADELWDLACNQQEVNQIQKRLGGKALHGTAASKVRFQQEAPHYQIVHLATHSCLDDQNPMLNKIFLSDDYLANYDLFNLNLRADLAVLSACNTGSGSLLRGEGIMSLSRGFFHAGCPSTLISLWSVEDCTTSEIMNTYYQYLQEGKTKDEALRQAKLQYLSSAGRLAAHPFFWAPFVQFGDTQALDLAPASKGWWKWGLGLLLLLLLRWVYNASRSRWASAR